MPMASCPATASARSNPGPIGNQITVEITEATDAADDTFKLTVSAPGKDSETYDNVSTKRGKNNVVTMVKEQSKLIQIEEIGSAGALERIPARGKVSLAGADGAKPMRLAPEDYVGDSADRTGFGGLEAIDEVTMLAVPDLMAVYQKGMIDLEGVQAVQQAMIAHCELMGDRVAILDAPPGLNAQQVKEWRVDKVGYDSKYATLYWPWIKVLDPVSSQGIFVPPSGHMAGIWARNDETRGVHKAPANENDPRRAVARAADHQGRARPAQPDRHQLHPHVPRPRHPRLGRADAVERSGVALSERPTPLQLRRGVDPRGHPVGRLRAERHEPLAARQAHAQRLPGPNVARRSALRRDSRRGVLRQVRRGDQPAGGHRRGAARRRDRHRAGQAG